MSRKLSGNSSLDALRREAKRWLKQIVAGDPAALGHFETLTPRRTGAGGIRLREVQHALALDYGHVSWASLKQEVEDRKRSHADRIALFLEKAVHRFGTDPRTQKWGDYEPDGPARGALAARLLARNPGIATDSIHTAVLAHDLDAVRGFLAKDPHLANHRGWIDGWTPLLRLAYARLPLGDKLENALPIAELLLDNGADPNAGWSDAINEFKPLTGVIGEGEGGQSPHPQTEAFARLLIARGADPFDAQALYNASLGPDSTFWLDLLWGESKKRGETQKWTGPSPKELGGDRIPSPLAYLLGNAVPNHPAHAAWLLEHGADASGVNFYSRQSVIKHAMLAGRQDVVDLLVAHGATPPTLSEQEQFLAAAATADTDALRRLAAAHPDFLNGPEPMFAAIRRNRTDLATLLLDLGMSPDVADARNLRALHMAAQCGAVEIANLLIARGAEIDPFDQRYGGTPLTHASYNARPEMVALLAPVSRNFRGLCFAGAVDRVSELLAEDPGAANREDRPGEPALFCMPNDEDRAVELAELLLSHGANPAFRNPLGQTPAEAARHRGLDEVAALLDDAAAPPDSG